MQRKDSFFQHLILVLPMRFFILLSFVLIYNVVNCQLKLNFDDGNIQTVKWLGNIENFKINTAGQLQLMTSGAGESTIFTKYKVPTDSIQFDAFFKMRLPRPMTI